MKNYIIVCASKAVARAKLKELCKPEEISAQTESRRRIEIFMKNGDFYLWVYPSKNKQLPGIQFERAYVDSKTDMKSVFYNDILLPITKHETFFDSSLIGEKAFSVTEDDIEAIWKGVWKECEVNNIGTLF